MDTIRYLFTYNCSWSAARSHQVGDTALCDLPTASVHVNYRKTTRYAPKLTIFRLEIRLLPSWGGEPIPPLGTYGTSPLRLLADCWLMSLASFLNHFQHRTLPSTVRKIQVTVTVRLETHQLKRQKCSYNNLNRHQLRNKFLFKSSKHICTETDCNYVSHACSHTQVQLHNTLTVSQKQKRQIR